MTHIIKGSPYIIAMLKNFDATVAGDTLMPLVHGTRPVIMANTAAMYTTNRIGTLTGWNTPTTAKLRTAASGGGVLLATFSSSAQAGTTSSNNVNAANSLYRISGQTHLYINVTNASATACTFDIYVIGYLVD